MPIDIEFSQEKILYGSKKLYSLNIDGDGNIMEELHVRFDLDALMSQNQKYYIDSITQSELINKHKLLIYLKKKILELLVKHPISEDVALVKHECSKVEDLAFFIKYTHLKEHGFLAWQENELHNLPKTNRFP